MKYTFILNTLFCDIVLPLWNATMLRCRIHNCYNLKISVSELENRAKAEA